jgi:hypothetical protein
MPGIKSLRESQKMKVLFRKVGKSGTSEPDTGKINVYHDVLRCSSPFFEFLPHPELVLRR